MNYQNDSMAKESAPRMALGQQGAIMGQNANLAAAQVRQPSVTETFANQLEQLVAHFREVKERQAMLMERLHGPRPCNPKEAGNPPCNGGALALIEERMRWLAEIAKEILDNQIILDRMA